MFRDPVFRMMTARWFSTGLWCKFHLRTKLRAGVNFGSGGEHCSPNLWRGFALHSKLI
jgi:hypothetical protein